MLSTIEVTGRTGVAAPSSEQPLLRPQREVRQRMRVSQCDGALPPAGAIRKGA
jgi:hypothetical protein